MIEKILKLAINGNQVVSDEDRTNSEMLDCTLTLISLINDSNIDNKENVIKVLNELIESLI